MSDLKNTSVDIVKYLDLEGLKSLWAKIDDKFVRKSNLIESLTTVSENGIITNNDDLFVRQSTINELSERLEGIEAGQSVKVDGNTITQDVDGTISTNLILFDDPDEHKLCLITGGSDDPKSNIISEWDYSNLYSEAIKNGMIKDVSLVVIPSDETAEESGQGEGTYLKFEFETSAGESSPIYVNVSDLIDVYTGSTYIKVEGDTISLETAQLVTYLKTDEALGITSITSRVDTIETEIGSLTDRISTIESLIDDLNIGEIAEAVETMQVKITEFEAILAGVPTTRITEAEIDALDSANEPIPSEPAE